MVSDPYGGDAGAHLGDDRTALVAEDRREQAFRIGSGQGEGVGVTDAGRFDFEKDLSCLRSFEIDGFDRERHTGPVCHSGFDFQGGPPPGPERSLLNAV